MNPCNKDINYRRLLAIYETIQRWSISLLASFLLSTAISRISPLPLIHEVEIIGPRILFPQRHWLREDLVHVHVPLCVQSLDSPTRGSLLESSYSIKQGRPRLIKHFLYISSFLHLRVFFNKWPQDRVTRRQGPRKGACLVKTYSPIPVTRLTGSVASVGSLFDMYYRPQVRSWWRSQTPRNTRESCSSYFDSVSHRSVRVLHNSTGRFTAALDD